MSEIEDQVVAAVTERFRTFGGGRVSPSNPISHALRDEPPQFAAGVDVREVVRFVGSLVVAEFQKQLHSALAQPEAARRAYGLEGPA